MVFGVQLLKSHTPESWTQNLVFLPFGCEFPEVFPKDFRQVDDVGSFGEYILHDINPFLAHHVCSSMFYRQIPKHEVHQDGPMTTNDQFLEFLGLEFAIVTNVS